MDFATATLLMDASITRDGLALGPFLHTIPFIINWTFQDATANFYIPPADIVLANFGFEDAPSLSAAGAFLYT